MTLAEFALTLAARMAIPMIPILRIPAFPTLVPYAARLGALAQGVPAQR
jgi:hypothetical protein